MRIYVPTHLRKLGILKNFCDMIQAYEKDYSEGTGSFDDYQTYLKIDPVRRFISLCIPETDQDYETVLSYLTRLFYSLRGTTKVFEYMKSMLGLEFEGEVIYTTRTLGFTLAEIKGDDAAVFDQYLREFLGALVYFENLDYRVTNLTIRVENVVPFKVGAGLVTWKKHEL